MAPVHSDRLHCVDLEPGDEAMAKNAGGQLEPHPTDALAYSLLLAALALASGNGCTGGSSAVPDAGEQPVREDHV
jgi:hypothetical protein